MTGNGNGNDNGREGRTHRREFLERAGLAATAAFLGGAGAESARGFRANDTIRVACLGTGGRCRALMRPLATLPNVRIVAVCDVWDDALGEARKLADGNADAVKDYRRLLDRRDVDAVLIGAPDHWHVPMTVDACDAGKDVYVEKPLTHKIEEGAAVVDAKNRNARIVQVGTQQRSMPHFIKARELLKAGRIGEVFRIHLSWNRNTGDRFQRGNVGVDPARVDWRAFLGSAPDQPFDAYKFRNWRWFWDFGGGILTDLMVHFIDVAHWFLDSDGPDRAAAFGQFVAARDLWETPDTIQCALTYGEGVQAHFEGTFSNALHGARIEFLGPRGTLYLDRGRYELLPERDAREPESWVLGSDPRKGRDFYDNPDGELLHLANWIECVRSRRTPSCPVEAGVSASMAAHLGNESLRKGAVASRRANPA